MGWQFAVRPVEAGLLNRRHTNHFDPKREIVGSKPTRTKKKQTQTKYFVKT